MEHPFIHLNIQREAGNDVTRVIEHLPALIPNKSVALHANHIAVNLLRFPGRWTIIKTDQ